MSESLKVNKVPFVVLFALLLRLIGLDQSLWMDEAISATVAKNYSFYNIWNQFALGDTHPPLYYIVLKIWTSIFGFSEVSLRFPSVLFGVATVFVVYLIGKKVFSQKVGLLASALLTTSGLHVYYSQEARMYAMSTFLVSLTVLMFFEKKWKTLAASLLILAMTDYLPMTITLVLIGLTIFVKANRKYVLPMSLSIVPSLFFYNYWAKTFILQSTSTLSYLKENTWWGSILGESSVKNLTLVWIKFIIGRIDFDNPVFYGFLVSVVSIVFGYFLIKSIKNIKKSAFFWLLLIIPFIISFLGSFKIPGFSYFRFIFLLPSFYILLSDGIEVSRVSKLSVGIILLLNISFSLMYLGNSGYHREDWKHLVPFVENRLNTNEAVFVSYPEPFAPYLWYSKRPGLIEPFSKESAGKKNGVYTLDYLMDVIDPDKIIFTKLENLGFRETNIYNFRGTGQVRYWVRE